MATLYFLSKLSFFGRLDAPQVNIEMEGAIKPHKGAYKNNNGK